MSTKSPAPKAPVAEKAKAPKATTSVVERAKNMTPEERAAFAQKMKDSRRTPEERIALNKEKLLKIDAAFEPRIAKVEEKLDKLITSKETERKAILDRIARDERLLNGGTEAEVKQILAVMTPEQVAEQLRQLQRVQRALKHNPGLAAVEPAADGSASE